MIKNRIKLLAFDLDDTLLNSNKEIGDGDAIREAISRGVKVVFCSGRPLVLRTLELYKEIGFYDDAYYVGYNGVAIYKVSDQSIVSINNLNHEDLNYIYNIVKKEVDKINRNFALYTHYNNKVYTDVYNDYVMLENKYNNIEVCKCKYWADKAFSAHKFMVAADPKDIKVLYEAIKDKLPNYNCLISMPCFIEVFRKDVDKYQGLKKVAELYNIKEDEIMAFGDSNNDYPMIKNSYIGVAMGNSVREIKEISDYVTDDNDHFGITKALKKYKVID